MFKKSQEKKEKKKNTSLELKQSKKKLDDGFHPLGMPRGSVRAILVLILTIFLGACIIVEREIPEQIAVVWLAFLGYYLGHRSDT